ncbi:hypothetical protein HYH03_019102, partial [Edaphochlamys debaryana]
MKSHAVLAKGSSAYGILPHPCPAARSKIQPLGCRRSVRRGCGPAGSGPPPSGGTGGVGQQHGLVVLDGEGQVLWLKRNEPDVYDRTATVLLPHDYVNLYLTGRKVMECGDASGTGLMDIPGRRWDAAAVAAVDERLGGLLPPLVDEPTGGDNAMSALGAGAASAGAVVVSLGTSGTIFAKSPTPVLDPSGLVCPFADATGAFLPLAVHPQLHATAGG